MCVVVMVDEGVVWVQLVEGGVGWEKKICIKKVQIW